MLRWYNEDICYRGIKKQLLCADAIVIAYGPGPRADLEIWYLPMTSRSPAVHIKLILLYHAQCVKCIYQIREYIKVTSQPKKTLICTCSALVTRTTYIFDVLNCKVIAVIKCTEKLVFYANAIFLAKRLLDFTLARKYYLCAAFGHVSDFHQLLYNWYLTIWSFCCKSLYHNEIIPLQMRDLSRFVMTIRHSL